MSTHVIPVVEVKDIRPHPNADRLELVTVNGWQCAIQKDSFKPGDLAVYIEPDYMVPVTRPEFAFLKDPHKFDQTHARIKARRLRGEMSYGLLIPVPKKDNGSLCDCAQCEETYNVGDNLIDQLGIHRWEPPMVGKHSTSGLELGKKFCPPLEATERKFDMENINNFPGVLDYTIENVVITEKIHGTNARYLWWEGEFYIGSRSRWLKRPSAEELAAQGGKLDVWHTVADRLPEIEKWCRVNEGTILYGEIYGNVQDLKYGLHNDATFAGFAAYDCVANQWIPTDILLKMLALYKVPTVPLLWVGTIRFEELAALLETDSKVATAPDKHMMEGVVITPLVERRDPRVGRVCFKLISTRYWTRKL